MSTPARALGTARDLARAIDRHLPGPVRRLVRRVANRDLLLTASSLGFYGLVSALPLLMIAFWLIEAIAGDDTLRTFADQVAESGPEGSGQFLDQLVDNGGSLTTVTLLFAVWPATAYGGALRRALSHQAERDETAPGLRGRLLGLSLVLALPALVLAGVPLMFFLTTLSGDGLAATLLGWSLALVGGVVVATGLTALLYRAFAPGSLGWRDTARGAALTAAVTTVFSLGFAIYLKFADIEDRFGGGTIGVVIVLGLWLFVANILLLAGYEAILELTEEDDQPAVPG